MNTRLFLLLGIFFTLLTNPMLSYANPASTQDLYSFATDDAAKRFETWTKNSRCVVCQNQSIADSDAPLAKDLRDKIYQMIHENKSDETIRTYLVQRYGNFILLQPPLNQTTFLLWTFPLLALIITSFILGRLFYTKKNTI